MPRRGGLRFVLVLTGLRRLDGDTIASRDGLWAIDLRLGLGPEDLLGLGLANLGGPDGDRLGTLGRQADLLVAVRGDDQGGGRDARLAVLHRTDPLGHALVQLRPGGLDGRAADLERPRRFLPRNCLISSSFRPTAPGQAGQPGRRHRPRALGQVAAPQVPADDEVQDCALAVPGDEGGPDARFPAGAVAVAAVDDLALVDDDRVARPWAAMLSLKLSKSRPCILGKLSAVGWMPDSGRVALVLFLVLSPRVKSSPASSCRPA